MKNKNTVLDGLKEYFDKTSPEQVKKDWDEFAYLDIPDNTDDNTIQELDYIKQCLDEANVYGLQCEVILWSLKYAKNNPEASIQECMEAGMNEWDV